MPNTQTKGGRVPVHVRLTPAGIEAVDRLAATEQRSRSDMLRILIGEAVANRAKKDKR